MFSRRRPHPENKYRICFTLHSDSTWVLTPNNSPSFYIGKNASTMNTYNSAGRTVHTSFIDTNSIDTIEIKLKTNNKYSNTVKFVNMRRKKDPKSRCNIRGERTNHNIVQTIMENNEQIREDFYERKKERPHLKGRVTMKIVVDQMGKVVKCQIINKSTTLHDEIFHEKLKKRIFEFNFGHIDIKDDTTEFNYPFLMPKWSRKKNEHAGEEFRN